MVDWPMWRCGHPKTPDNTVGRAKGQCRECNKRSNRNAYRNLTPTERYLKYRMRYLPEQIEATEHKLRALRNEAERLGLLSSENISNVLQSHCGAAESAPVNGEPSFEQRAA